MNPIEEQITKELGYDRSKPHVQFYEHAVKNAKRSEAAGRPKYDTSVYILKTPSAPDLVVRNTFSRQMIEQDKKDYPQEWARYVERKQQRDNFNPMIRGIPGMTAAALAELRDLEIVTCRDLVNYGGNLDELETLRDIAEQVLDIGDRIRAGRERQAAPELHNVVTIKPQPVIQNFHYEFTV